jgi:ketosteroid isomerase-like protein
MIALHNQLRYWIKLGCVHPVSRERLEGRRSAMPDNAIAIAKKSYQAYVDKNRAAIEAVIAEDFHFTSPLDNRLDRKTYFERCWPNSETIAGFEYKNLVQDGDRVFVTYEGTGKSGKRFRNTEILTIRDGKVIEAEVYFGWTIPHEAPEGGFVGK